MITRRRFLSTAVIPLAGMPLAAAFAAAPADLAAELARIERGTGGRLGVAGLDTGDGRRIGHRQDARFAMCSTFKFLAAACVLARVDKGQEQLDRRIVIKAEDLQEYAPVTRERLGGDGMSLAELCDAAVTQSDNTAANALLASFGGPAGLTRYVRSLGDSVTRLDRNEPGLNAATPGDVRDTTSPRAMLQTMRKILLGDALSTTSRERLQRWLDDNKTGNERIRAGLPADWRVGDKTGSGSNGTANDIAIIRPPGRAPLLLCVYLTGAKVAPPARNAAIAAAAKAFAAWV